MAVKVLAELVEVVLAGICWREPVMVFVRQLPSRWWSGCVDGDNDGGACRLKEQGLQKGTRKQQKSDFLIAYGINDGNASALAQAIKSAVVVLIDRGGNRGPRIALFSSRKPLAMDPSCTRPAQEGAALESKEWALGR
jgi:hypothetical protein